MTQTFEIIGNPVAQGRPRFFRRGSFVGTFDPEKSKTWKEIVAMQIINQKPIKMQGALRLSLQFFLPRPKSLPKKTIHHTKKPDIDNLCKAIKDSLRGICYHDDSQIIELIAKKQYAEVTGVTITLSDFI